jgi:Zn finger protein HypA/HybF involved in hydrogenase expression
MFLFIRRMVMRGDKVPRGDGWKEATLWTAVKANQKLRFWCDDCRHEVIVEALEFTIDHNINPATPFYTLAQRLRCGQCGSRKVGIMMASHQVGDRR